MPVDNMVEVRKKVDPLKLCIIGRRGHIGYTLDGLQSLPQVEVCGVSAGCDDDMGMVHDRLRDMGRPAPVHGDWREMLETLQPDMVAIDGPFELHGEMCVAALDLGIHVFCEKPMATDLEQLRAIEASVQAHPNLLLFSMVGLRYSPDFFTANSLIKRGQLGEVKLLHAQKSYKLRQRPEHYKKRATYGGTIPWVGSHALDWIYWMSGSEFKSVQALHSRDGNMDHGELEATALCQFTMKNGAMASASIDYLRPTSAATHGDDRIRVVGTEGILEVRGGEVLLIDKAGESTLELEDPPNIFEDFVAELEGKGLGVVDTEQSLHLTKACLLAREAADTGILQTL